jgi:hypothetical protein
MRNRAYISTPVVEESLDEWPDTALVDAYGDLCVEFDSTMRNRKRYSLRARMVVAGNMGMVGRAILRRMSASRSQAAQVAE